MWLCLCYVVYNTSIPLFKPKIATHTFYATIDHVFGIDCIENDDIDETSTIIKSDDSGDATTSDENSDSHNDCSDDTSSNNKDERGDNSNNDDTNENRYDIERDVCLFVAKSKHLHDQLLVHTNIDCGLLNQGYFIATQQNVLHTSIVNCHRQSVHVKRKNIITFLFLPRHIHSQVSYYP